MRPCSLHPLSPHADRGFNKIVHVFLRSKIPGVSLVPGADDQLAAIQEAGLSELRNRVRLVPHHELKRVEDRIESFMPFPELIVTRKGEKVASRLKHSHKVRSPL